MLVDRLDLHRQFNANIPPKSRLKGNAIRGTGFCYTASQHIHTNLIHGDDNNLEDVDMITADDPNDYDTNCSTDD